MRILGLDLSFTSAGVAMVDCTNPAEMVYRTEIFSAPRAVMKANSGLKDALVSIYYSSTFRDYVQEFQPDVVVLEDVYAGPNPRVTKTLTNINMSVPTELLRMLMDGEDLSVKYFAHTNANGWRGWVLRNTEKGYREFTYQKDKKRLIKERLKGIGFDVDHTPGEEDRYDALGMAAGWYLNYASTGEKAGVAIDDTLLSRLLPGNVIIPDTGY